MMEEKDKKKTKTGEQTIRMLLIIGARLGYTKCTGGQIHSCGVHSSHLTKPDHEMP